MPVTRRKKRLFIAGSFAFVALIIIASFGMRAGGDAAKRDALLARPLRPPPRVIVDRVVQEDVVDNVWATATTRAIHTEAVPAQIAGRAEQVLVDIGDYVRAGDLLVTFHDDDILADVANLRGGLASARAALAFAEWDYANKLRLFESGDRALGGIVTQEAVQIARRERDSTRARAATSEAQLYGALQRLGYTAVLAPRTGLISTRDVEAGQWVTTGRTMFEIVDLSAVEARVRLAAGDLVDVRVGTQVGPLDFAGVDLNGVTGTVIAAAPVPTAEAGVYDVKLRIDKPTALWESRRPLDPKPLTGPGRVGAPGDGFPFALNGASHDNWSGAAIFDQPPADLSQAGLGAWTAPTLPPPRGRALDPTIESLRSTVSEEREHAYVQLIASADPRAVVPLRRALANETDDRMRVFAAAAMAFSGDFDGVRVLFERGMATSDNAVRIQAFEVLTVLAGGNFEFDPTRPATDQPRPTATWQAWFADRVAEESARAARRDRLEAGVAGRIRISRGVIREAIVVPEIAVQVTGTESFVWRLHSQQAEVYVFGPASLVPLNLLVRVPVRVDRYLEGRIIVSRPPALPPERRWLLPFDWVVVSEQRGVGSDTAVDAITREGKRLSQVDETVFGEQD